MLNQHIRLSFSSQTDGLGSEGIVCGIRTSGNVIPFGGGQPGSTLAVQFVQLSAEDEQVIALLLTEGRSRSIGVCVAAALVTQESEEVLLDTGSQPSVITSKSGAHSVGDRGGPRQERRRHRRVAVELASEVCLLDGAGDRVVRGAVTKALTATGACGSLSAEEGLTGSKISLEWTRSAGPTQGSMVESVATKTCSLMGPVMWTKTERETANNGLAEATGRTVLAGDRFLPLANNTAKAIETLREQTPPRAEASRSDGPSVISEFSECFRPSGGRIVLCHDRPRTEVADDAPIVVLAPGYGESKRDYVPLAYYLAGNGFHVVRYDNVNHVGESDGVVTQFRLQDMELDLETVLNYVAVTWPDRPIGLVATSLAGRVALKVTGGTTHVKLLVLINGIMDIRHTLQAVHQEDLIGEHLAGVRKGVVNILGLTIDADRWLAHAVQGNYANLATTQCDAKRLRTPVVLFSCGT